MSDLSSVTTIDVFIQEKVDVAVIEAHLGGEFDATNVLITLSVSVICNIDLDHLHLLGPTIEDVTWHKVGILKLNTIAFSSPQTLSV